MQIELNLVKDEESLSLVETCFIDDKDGQQIVCVRGGGAGHHGCGTFPWTKGVRALTLLLVKNALSALKQRDSRSKKRFDMENSMLIGYADTPAASLDYALSKEPNWLCDMFGLTLSGEMVARRLLRRTNPERKLPGPVRISLNSRAGLEILVYLNGQKIDQVTALCTILEQLEEEWISRSDYVASSDRYLIAC